jgi:RimJ/RimL family protein N-acetyltransferase
LLRGEKVNLRPVKRTDIEYFLKWYTNPEVIQYLTIYLPMTEMVEEKFIEGLGTSRLMTTVFFVIEAIEGGTVQPIGTMELGDLNNKDRCGTFGIAIGDKDYWSKGCGTEAARLIIRYGFEQINLHRINSEVYSFNERSLRLHKKVGFTEEGRRREAGYRNGRYHDDVFFGILKSEWLAQTNK